MTALGGEIASLAQPEAGKPIVDIVSLHSKYGFLDNGRGTTAQPAAVRYRVPGGELAGRRVVVEMRDELTGAVLWRCVQDAVREGTVVIPAGIELTQHPQRLDFVIRFPDGGTSNTLPGHPYAPDAEPYPTIEPTAVRVGTTASALTLRGAGFTPESVVAVLEPAGKDSRVLDYGSNAYVNLQTLRVPGQPRWFTKVRELTFLVLSGPPAARAAKVSRPFRVPEGALTVVESTAPTLESVEPSVVDFSAQSWTWVTLRGTGFGEKCVAYFHHGMGPPVQERVSGCSRPPRDKTGIGTRNQSDGVPSPSWIASA